MGTQDKRDKKSYLTRESVLNLLSDDEIAKISAAESRPLVEGDDYVDLEHPERGVLKVIAGSAPRPGSALPRSAVRDETWGRVVALVGR